MNGRNRKEEEYLRSLLCVEDVRRRVNATLWGGVVVRHRYSGYYLGVQKA